MNNHNTKSQEKLACPRCDSSNTKFHSYNNKKLSQPCHFCKSCRRYWTHGGTLRHIYVGSKSATRSHPNTTSTTAVSGLGQSIAIPSTASVFNEGGSVFCGKGKVRSSTSLLDTQGTGSLASGGIGGGGGGSGGEGKTGSSTGMNNTRLQLVRTNAELYVPVYFNKKGVKEGAAVVNHSVVANVSENAAVVNDSVIVDDTIPAANILTHCDDLSTSQAHCPSTRVKEVATVDDQDKLTTRKKNRVQNGIEGDNCKAGPSFQSPAENGADITMENNTQPPETATGSGEYTDLYGFKLEARIVQLERIFAELKTKFGGNGE